MIVLNDSTAQRIKWHLSVLVRESQRFDPDELTELMKVLGKPLPEGYGRCKTCFYEDTSFLNGPCNSCLNAKSYAVAIGWEPK